MTLKQSINRHTSMRRFTLIKPCRHWPDWFILLLTMQST